MLDCRITGAWIVDGSGDGRYRGDIGIRGESIAAIGNLGGRDAARDVDAGGLVATPGFIDVHSHGDLALFRDPRAPEKVAQGITTEIVGNCGLAPVPVRPHSADLLREYIGPLLGAGEEEWGWASHADYLEAIRGRGINPNMAFLVGHNALRIAVMGMDARSPGEKEMVAMERLLCDGLREGALGLSTGLLYVPGKYAEAEELVRLARVVARHGGIYTTHMRDEGRGVLSSVQETLDVARRAGPAVQISHHKVNDPRAWGGTRETLHLITGGRAEGLRVTCDQYPYRAGNTLASTLCPPWVLEGGPRSFRDRLRSEKVRDRLRVEIREGSEGWDSPVQTLGWHRIMIGLVRESGFAHLEGRSFREAGELEGRAPADLLFELLLSGPGDPLVILFQQWEEDLRRVMRYPHSMFGTDGIVVKRSHPRLFGTYPRVLGTYVRGEGVLSLEGAVRKMTYLPAATFGLRRRGLLREGYRADIVLFDPGRVRDRGDYANPDLGPEGIERVYVNGREVLAEGEVRESRPGRILGHRSEC